MHTDKQLLAIFEAMPEWLFLLAGKKSPGACELSSVTFKEVEQRADAVIIPADPRESISIAEFQTQEDDTVYERATMETILAMRKWPDRNVETMIFFLERQIDPKDKRWCDLIPSFSLRKQLEELAKQSPSHPLVAVFQPLLQSDEKLLELNVAEYYNQIQNSKLGKRVKWILSKVFVSWMKQRFKGKDMPEMDDMREYELAVLQDTQPGKDLIKIGYDEGKIDGEIRGKQQLLISMLRAKFGRVPRDTRKYILNLNEANKLDELGIQISQCTSLDQLKW